MFKLSKKMIYALEAVVDIAYNAGENPSQSRDITKRQGIPKRYLEQVMQRLVRVGVLKGVRGPRGGYTLARERRRITVGLLARVLQEVSETQDPLKTNGNSELADRVIRPVWYDLENTIMKELDSITIEDLCQKAHKKGIKSDASESIKFDI